MQELDKAAMGRRIRQIRLGAKLRQWELAKLLGTTQSAVHKYEHGVVPEPRRLVELSKRVLEFGGLLVFRPDARAPTLFYVAIVEHEGEYVVEAHGGIEPVSYLSDV